jgi:pyrroloquinoline quinone (PQQ) biosynthesis protein C
MDRSYYSAGSIRAGLASMERRYKMSSAEFYRRYQNDELSCELVPRYAANLWAGLYEELKAAGDDSALAEQVDRLLAAG